LSKTRGRSSERALVAIVALAAAGLVAFQLLIVPNLGDPVASASRTATPTRRPTPTPAVLLSPAPYQNLEPGALVSTKVTPFRITVTVPAGWFEEVEDTSSFTLWDRPGSAGSDVVTYRTIDDLRADPCDPEQGDLGIGPGVSDLVDALAAIPGVAQSSVTDVTISSFSGKFVDVVGTADCVRGVLLPSGVADGIVLPRAGWELRWYILDVSGSRLVIGIDYASESRRPVVEAIVHSTEVEVH
jgi:hypothetical protein